MTSYEVEDLVLRAVCLSCSRLELNVFVVQEIIYATVKNKKISVEMEVQGYNGNRKTQKSDLERKEAISLSPMCGTLKLSGLVFNPSNTYIPAVQGFIYRTEAAPHFLLSIGS